MSHVVNSTHAMQKNALAFVTAMLSNVEESEDFINPAETVRALLLSVFGMDGCVIFEVQYTTAAMQQKFQQFW
jgi:hypothetical protein